jgi:predicted MFS family arabinose efflux permease
MVGAGWVDGGQAGMLGAAALFGYLLGTAAGRRAGLRFGVPGTLDRAMALLLVALLACAWNGGFWWLMGWRTLAGVAGGLLMALAGPATQASVPVQARGRSGGIVIAGVPAGIGLGAVLVPALLPWGVAAAWLALAGLVAALWAFAHRRWPDMALAGAAAARPPRARLLLLTHGWHAAGMVPPMVYLADLAARGRGLGVEAGALVWLVFGAAGLAGGLLSGRLTDRLGGVPTLRLWLGIQAAALALCLPPAPALILPAAALAGFAAVGITAVVLTVTREVAPAQAAGLWGQTAAVFALVQTAMGFALAWLFAATGESHAAVFSAGLVFSVLAGLTALRLPRGAAPARGA